MTEQPLPPLLPDAPGGNAGTVGVGTALGSCSKWLWLMKVCKVASMDIQGSSVWGCQDKKSLV